VNRDRDARQAVADLYTSLMAPPYGLRAGPLPVILTAYLLLNEDEVALYEDGVLVPELRIEVLERLLRAPQSFHLRSHKLSRAQRELLKSLKAISALGSGHDRSDLLPTVKALVAFAANLSPYARQTRRSLAAEIVLVRDLILGATDPAELLFKDLPVALGVEELKGVGIARFAERLREGLRALGLVYPRLLDELEGQFRGVLGLTGSSGTALLQLAQRASALTDFVTDPRLLVFVREASREAPGDWRERLARAVKDGYPPSHWRDADLGVFQARLSEIAIDFHRLEEIASLHRRDGARRIVRLSALDHAKQEHKRTFALSDDPDTEVSSLAGAIRAAIGRKGGSTDDDRTTQLEALGLVVAELLTNQAPSAKANL
jgi:hypothetical protein